MTTELQKLLEERKALNAKIKSLESKEMRCGNVSINFDNINTKTWRVTVFRRSLKGKWHPDARETIGVSVITDKSRDAVVSQIPKLIADLNELYQTIKERDEDT